MIRQRNTDCPSDLRLDQWLAGELTQVDRDALEAHAASCEPCRRRRSELIEAQRSFASSAPVFAALAGRAPSRPRWWRAAAPVLAAAAALLLALGRPWQYWLERDDGATRTKGSVAQLSWVVRRGGRVVVGRPDQPLHAGDALGFAIRAREPVYVAVLGRDAAGRVSVYYPEAAELALVSAGGDQPLPLAVELDATPGDEQLHGVFCRRPVPVAQVKEAIERAPGAPALPPGCNHELATLHKEAP
jgi:hypothetical protein